MTFPFSVAGRTAMLAIAVTACMALPAGADENERVIAVSGEGETAIAPDMATVSLSVVSEGETAREALDENNATIGEVIATLRDDGIEERDIQTSEFSINPRYVYPDEDDAERVPRIAGYEVVNGLSVRLRDLERIGDVLDAAVTLGVNSGGQISFSNADPADAQAAARRQAVEDARARAETLAEAAGVRLGAVLSIDETANASAPQPMARMEAMRAADASVPIARGENLYRIAVEMRFAIDADGSDE